MRGCFGGCTFCSITEHEGRVIQNRSEDSILREVETIRDTVPGFTGIISDLGGPTANMYRMACHSAEIEAACRRPSCVYPGICSHLNTDHAPLIPLYRKARALPGIKKILIGSGLRYDLAVQSPDYIRELAAHHVGGFERLRNPRERARYDRWPCSRSALRPESPPRPPLQPAAHPLPARPRNNRRAGRPAGG